MKYTHIAYPGHHYLPQFRTFLLDTYRRYGMLRNWEPRRLLGYVYHRHPNEAVHTLTQMQSQWHLWLDHTHQIVGAIICEDPSSLFVQTHPDHLHLIDEMVTWAETHPTYRTADIWCHDNDAALTSVLQQHGYQQHTAYMAQKYCDLRTYTSRPNPVPAGYSITTMQRDSTHTDQMATLLNLAFERTMHSGDEYANFQKHMPDYRTQSDWIVRSPHGELVCTVGMTYYDDVQLVIIEPVATHPAHQGLGLAQATITHGLYVAQRAGIVHAWVEVWHGNSIADRAYTRAGFLTVSCQYLWHKMP